MSYILYWVLKGGTNKELIDSFAQTGGGTSKAELGRLTAKGGKIKAVDVVSNH